MGVSPDNFIKGGKNAALNEKTVKEKQLKWTPELKVGCYALQHNGRSGTSYRPNG